MIAPAWHTCQIQLKHNTAAHDFSTQGWLSTHKVVPTLRITGVANQWRPTRNVSLSRPVSLPYDRLVMLVLNAEQMLPAQQSTLSEVGGGAVCASWVVLPTRNVRR